MTDLRTLRDRAEKLTRKLADQGKIIEGGWAGLKIMAVPPNAPQVQVIEMRKAFFAGALHLFSCIMNVLDGSEEPTAGDLRRMVMIERELDEFEKELTAQYMPTDGRA